MSDFKKKFGANLKKLRKSRNITQEKLAELIDIHFRQMSKIETGENFPSSKTIENICYALKISPAKLFDFDFIYDGEIILTGTDDIPYYKATRQGNVIVLEDYQGKKVDNEKISISDSEKKFLKMAQNLNRAITVEYFENGIKSKVLTYNPDGSISSSTEKNILEKGLEDIMNLLKNTKPNLDYINFVKLAIRAIENDTDLDRLESMISGIKLARKK